MTIVTYAQNFEDVILWRALRDVEQGRYVDIGAHDPVADSVSLAFYEKGWRGIHIEPTPTYAAKLREARPDEIVIEAAVTDATGPIRFHEIPETGLSTGRADIAKHHFKGGFENREIVVPSIRLDQLLEMAGQNVHWLKIDVEGMEADVLRSWGDSPLRPWIVVVEATYPGTQRSTKDLWIEEVAGRGYKEVYFDGVSVYFLHEAHADLAERFLAPPNVFDDFQVGPTHFSAWTLKENLSKEREHLFAEARKGEAQLAQEREGVRREMETLSVSMREMQAGRASAAEALVAAEREHRASIDRAWRERQASEASLRGGWLALENDLRGQIASVECQLREGDAERGALRERTEQQLERIGEFRQEAEAFRQRMAELENEISAVRTSSKELQKQAAAEIAELEHQIAEQRGQIVERERRIAELDREVAIAQSEALDLLSEQRRLSEIASAERDDFSRQLAEIRGLVATADEIIRNALAQPLDGWQRLGRALALSRGDGTKQVLRSWDSSSQPNAETVDAYMSLISPGGERNPYLRADSLAELLAWNDVDFVRCAYVTILGRQPDRSGEVYYTDRIREGISKMHVLWQLRTSKEASSHDPGIAGLDRALRRARRARLPVVGVFFRLLTDEEGSGSSERRHRALINKVERVEASQRRLVEELARIRSQAERPTVVLPSLLSAANDGGDGRPQAFSAFAAESEEARVLSGVARKLYHRFTGAR